MLGTIVFLLFLFHVPESSGQTGQSPTADQGTGASGAAGDAGGTGAAGAISATGATGTAGTGGLVECPAIRRITTINCGQGPGRMTCPGGSTCLTHSTGYSFCCWDETAIVSSPCTYPMMRGADFVVCDSRGCPDACYSCQPLRGMNSGLCCPRATPECAARTMAGSVMVPGAGTTGGGGVVVPGGMSVSDPRFGGMVAGGMTVPDPRAGVAVPGGITIPDPRVGAVIPGGMTAPDPRAGAVVPGGMTVPDPRAGAVVPGGMTVPDPRFGVRIPGGLSITDPRVRVVVPGGIPAPGGGAGMAGGFPRPAMMGEFCVGGSRPLGLCFGPYGCPPFARCMRSGSGRGICCPLRAGVFSPFMRRFSPFP